MLSVSQVIDDLKINPSCAEVLAPYWDESLKTLPEGPIDSLRPEEITINREWCDLPPELDPILVQVAEKIENNHALRKLFWHIRSQIMRDDDIAPELSKFPLFVNILEDHHCLFYLLIGISFRKQTHQTHIKLGIPENITKDTLSQVRSMFETYGTANNGQPGITIRALCWLRHQMYGRLFRVGRFEYKHSHLRPFVHIFRHKSDKTVLALAKEDRQYTNDGNMVLKDMECKRPQWTSQFTISDKEATGHPIQPTGKALQDKITLDLNEWDYVAKPGDYFLDMHIPAGGGMTPELSFESFRDAITFYNTYFPEQTFKGFSCYSWIFDPTFEAILSPDSNLVKLIKEVYLFPLNHPPHGGFNTIFHQSPDDLSTIPRKTSLQRAVASHYDNGGILKSGGMFLLNEELDAFGTQPYRKMWEKIRCQVPGIREQEKP